MRTILRMRVEGPPEVEKHTFAVKPMSMDIQFPPDGKYNKQRGLLN